MSKPKALKPPQAPKESAPEKPSLIDQFLRRAQGEAIEIAATTEEIEQALARVVVDEMSSAQEFQRLQGKLQTLEAVRNQIYAELKMRASE